MGKNKEKIAIDIGYGFTKVKTKEKLFKFPSAISFAKINSDEKELISFNGKSFKVGEEATIDCIVTTDYQFVYEYAPLLLVKALELSGIKSNELELDTGLSLYDIDKPAEFSKTAKTRKDELIERLSNFVVNDIHYKIDVNILAQGQGAWLNYCLENSFNDEGIDAVIDIGYRTNDIVVIKNKKPLKDFCSADDKGVNTIVNELDKYLNKKFDIALSKQDIIEVLHKKYIKIYGAKKDLTIIISKIIDNFITSIFNSLKANYGSIFKNADRVIFVGGGAYILREYKDMFPANVIFPKDNLEYQNVLGYFKS